MVKTHARIPKILSRESLAVEIGQTRYHDPRIKAIWIARELKAKYTDNYRIISKERLQSYEKKAIELALRDYDVEHAKWSKNEISELVDDYMTKQRPGKSTGLYPHGWKLIKSLSRSTIIDMQMKIMNAHAIPIREHKSKLGIIPKADPLKYRGIRAVGLVRNVTEFIVHKKTTQGADIIEEQHGDKGTSVQIIITKLRIQNNVLQNQSVFIGITDLDSAYDVVHSDVNYTQHKMNHKAIDPRIYPIKLNAEKNDKLEPYIEGIRCVSFKRTIEKSQGGRCSGIDYSIHTNEPFRQLKAMNGDSSIDTGQSLYVDDMIFLQNTLSQLRFDMQFIGDQITDIGSKFKPKKCKIIAINLLYASNQDRDPNQSISLYGKDIERLAEDHEINYLGICFYFDTVLRIIRFDKQYNKCIQRTYSTIMAIPRSFVMQSNLLVKRQLLLASNNTYGYDVAVIEPNQIQRMNKSLVFGTRRLYGNHVTTDHSNLFILYGIKRPIAANYQRIIGTFAKVMNDSVGRALYSKQVELLSDHPSESNGISLKTRNIANFTHYAASFSNYYVYEIQRAVQTYNLDLKWDDEKAMKKAKRVIEDIHYRRDWNKCIATADCLIGYIFDKKKEIDIESRMMKYNSRLLRLFQLFVDTFSIDCAAVTRILRVILGNHRGLWEYNGQCCNLSISKAHITQHWINTHGVIENIDEINKRLTNMNVYKRGVMIRLLKIKNMIERLKF
eukprot:84083_1